jgi:tetratricopeptide (TPR) repeat protein
MRVTAVLTCWALAAVTGAAQQQPELVSPSGRAFFAQVDTSGTVARAESAAVRHPEDADTLLALGLAYARVWRYRDAVAAYTRAIARAPERAVLYRHRGHRYISLRRFADATADLTRAARLDSTSFDIWYHLGLAHFLSGRFADAAQAYAHCLALARSADDTVAAADWRWMALRRAGDTAGAAALLVVIGEDMPVTENGAYYQRLLFYQGRRTRADLEREMTRGDLERATVGFGLGHGLLLAGDTAAATAVFEAVTAGTYWPAFGFIAGEAELQRLRSAR